MKYTGMVMIFICNLIVATRETMVASYLNNKAKLLVTPGMQWVYGNKQLDQSEVFFHFTQLGRWH